MTLHEFLDCDYGPEGDSLLRQRLDEGDDVNARDAIQSETPLHVATRRRRHSAVTILLDSGAEIDAKTTHGKTAYAHAIRRGFGELVTLFENRGASTDLNDADRLAVAVVSGRLDEARNILAEHPETARSGNPEEDRLLADLAGRNNAEPVALLIAAGADLSATGLDNGTPLHQAAWFGQPANARLLIDAGAPLNQFDATHFSSPLGWAVHGSRYSGGAESRQELYVEIVRMLLDAKSSLHYPDQPNSDAYFNRLLEDAGPDIIELIRLAK